jgi:hypothetical protein
MVKTRICWKNDCKCGDEHYTLRIESLVVVIQSYYDSSEKLHIKSIQGAVLNSSSTNKLSSKVHDDMCACYDTVMNDLSKQEYEIKFVNTILEKYIIIHLQKKI